MVVVTDLITTIKVHIKQGLVVAGMEIPPLIFLIVAIIRLLVLQLGTMEEIDW